MEYVKTYYALDAMIRYYARLPRTIEVVTVDAARGETGDLCGTLEIEPTDISSRWKEPPQLVLANLNLSIGDVSHVEVSNRSAIEAFLRRYGPLSGINIFVGTTPEGHPGFYESVKKFVSFQKLLRSAWIGEAAAIEEIKNLAAPREGKHPNLKLWTGGRGHARFALRAEGIEIAVAQLKTFICLLFLEDRRAQRAKVCGNPDCPAPYFLQERKGQTFCTHKCAVLINVRRFRERQKQRAGRRKSRKSR